MTTLASVLVETAKDGRICPQPQRWNGLWQMLPERLRAGAGWVPAAPLILAAWCETSNQEKRKRFELHLHWADQHGVLDTVVHFLAGLRPADWHNAS